MNTRDWIELIGWAFSAGATWGTVKWHGRSLRREVRFLEHRVQELEFCLGANTSSFARVSQRQRKVLEEIVRSVQAILRKKG